MTRKLILFAFTLLISLSTFAQQTGNVVLFAEQGEAFYAILNGSRMNEEPVTNLKIQDLNQPGYKLKIIFENKALGAMDKNMMISPGNEVVYGIKQGKKGEYKLRYVSEAPLAQAPPPAVNQQVVVWGAPAPAATTTTTTVVEETHTTTTTSGGGVNTGATVGNTTGTTENVSMNVNMGGFGMDVSVTTSETGASTNVNSMGGGNMNSSMSTTTTTTTTTTTVEDNGGWAMDDGTSVGSDASAAPCPGMSDIEFERAKNSVKEKTFADSKMTLAKQITESNCIYAHQVKQIMELLTYEDSKLEYAKFAYGYCVDRNNYYKVNDAFNHESTIEELDEYINGR